MRQKTTISYQNALEMYHVYIRESVMDKQTRKKKSHTFHFQFSQTFFTYYAKKAFEYKWLSGRLGSFLLLSWTWMMVRMGQWMILWLLSSHKADQKLLLNKIELERVSIFTSHMLTLPWNMWQNHAFSIFLTYFCFFFVPNNLMKSKFRDGGVFTIVPLFP